MTITTVTISDVEGTELVDTKVDYDLQDSDPDSAVTTAGLYGYLIHYLFRTGKINDYIDEVVAELNAMEDESQDVVQNEESQSL